MTKNGKIYKLTDIDTKKKKKGKKKKENLWHFVAHRFFFLGWSIFLAFMDQPSFFIFFYFKTL